MPGNRGATGQKKKHWYEHVPKLVATTQGRKVTILWNQQVQADRTIPNNKPDIIIRDNEKGTCMLIDIANPGDRNVITKDAEILKYKDLPIETQRVWNVKAKAIPVIIGETGTISKSFRKYVSNIPGNCDVRKLQKTAIFGTANILRKVLTYKHKTADEGTRDRGTIKGRITATMYSLWTRFVARMCVCGYPA
jgi:hypothetical protein